MVKKIEKIEVSVIIPTHNRGEILNDCLRRLIDQDFPKNRYEIIIVDDGSKDNTEKIVEKIKKTSKVQIRYLYQKTQGQGIARNYGLRYAKGEIVIFIGDDILVLNDFIKQHLKFHNKYFQKNAAVLGLVSWDPRLELTPFMEWLTNGSSLFGKFGGHQFAYEKLADKKTANYNFFYTSNISLKRDLLKKHPFDTRFSAYGWEDIELGYRLTKRENLILYYNPFAIGYHYHEMNESSLAVRMRAIGYSAHLIHNKYPELKKVPSKFKKFVFWLISNPFSLFLLRKIRELSHDKYCTLYFYSLSKKYFLQGLKAKH